MKYINRNGSVSIDTEPFFALIKERRSHNAYLHENDDIFKYVLELHN